MEDQMRFSLVLQATSSTSPIARNWDVAVAAKPGDWSSLTDRAVARVYSGGWRRHKMPHSPLPGSGYDAMDFVIPVAWRTLNDGGCILTLPVEADNSGVLRVAGFCLEARVSFSGVFESSVKRNTDIGGDV